MRPLALAPAPAAVAPARPAARAIGTLASCQRRTIAGEAPDRAPLALGSRANDDVRERSRGDELWQRARTATRISADPAARPLSLSVVLQ